MRLVKSSNLGYPRIGENRKWKKSLEAYWKGHLDDKQFLTKMKKIRLLHLQKQKDAGLDLIPVGDFSFYDHMLDTASMFGLIPKRFNYVGGPVSLDTYFAMARGKQNAAASEMTKWFNTNYHYIVPELDETTPDLVENRPLLAYREAKQELNINGKPVIIGPFTFLKLSKGYSPEGFSELIELFIPLYAQILKELQVEGVEWVQIDEPSLVSSLTQEELRLIKKLYEELHLAAPKLNILLQTYFDAVDEYEALIQLPVQGIGLDFVHGKETNLLNLKKIGFPNDKTLAVGLIDGRNIWRSNLTEKLSFIQSISEYVPYERIIIQPSCSLLHVPVNLNQEVKLDSMIKDTLAFADEKIIEITTLSSATDMESSTIVQSELTAAQKALDVLSRSSSRDQHFSRMDPSLSRQLPFEERQKLQQEKWNLPSLPTTTIGSLPQTLEVRKARQQWRKGEWSKEQYNQFVKEQIQHWIKIQEDIGLDVLVHGEFERTDMVEFFGEKLAGFTFTQNGWVQSYGSRCVKPPIIFGNVEFIEPMTLDETLYAQSITNKPVKGMLTGPVTILNWSFVRDDIPRKDVTYQIAVALRHEVEALEAAGIEMIQIDEPALREGLPLKRNQWNEYLDWAVSAFRLTCSTVKNTTQIHTHMCYCEFHEIINSIQALDADVISIETSRSHGELIASFEENTYNKGIGLGVYDIHSPRVPEVIEMSSMIQRALKVLPHQLFWINPDCGLKTRGAAETIAALNNMVLAAREARKTYISDSEKSVKGFLAAE